MRERIPESDRMHVVQGFEFFRSDLEVAQQPGTRKDFAINRFEWNTLWIEQCFGEALNVRLEIEVHS